MTNELYAKFKQLVLEYVDDDCGDERQKIKALIHDMRAAALPSDATTYAKACRLVQGGCFAVYYSQCNADLEKVFGDEYEKSHYYRKNGEVKYRGDEAVIWGVYKHFIAQTIDKMVKEYGLEA